jgi:hypothetical protein
MVGLNIKTGFRRSLYYLAGAVFVVSVVLVDLVAFTVLFFAGAVFLASAGLAVSVLGAGVLVVVWAKERPVPKNITAANAIVTFFILIIFSIN